MKAQMYSVLNVLLFLGANLGSSSFTAKSSSDHTTKSLIVKVSGIRSSEGNIHILLFNQAVGFPANPEKAYKHVKSRASAGEVTVTIDNLPYGTYAIVSFHDLNSNQAFDKSWFGSPKEDYGFSNIPGEFCGMPSFQQTSFSVNQYANTVTIKLMNVD